MVVVDGGGRPDWAERQVTDTLVDELTEQVVETIRDVGPVLAVGLRAVQPNSRDQRNEHVVYLAEV